MKIIEKEFVDKDGITTVEINDYGTKYSFKIAEEDKEEYSSILRIRRLALARMYNREYYNKHKNDPGFKEKRRKRWNEWFQNNKERVYASHEKGFKRRYGIK